MSELLTAVPRELPVGQHSFWKCAVMKGSLVESHGCKEGNDVLDYDNNNSVAITPVFV